MEMQIKTEKENPLFNRKEIIITLNEKVTPSRIEVGKAISEKLSTHLDNIEIKKIDGRFGSNEFNVTAFVYDSKEDRMSTESKPRIIKEEKSEENKEEVKEELKEAVKEESAQENKEAEEKPARENKE